MHRFPLVVAASGLIAVAMTGCSSTNSSAGSPSGSQPAALSSAAVTGPITVFAAASLTETFTEIAHQFEAANPGTTVTLSFAGSSALATQITSGAPADVFAAASAQTMQTVVDTGAATGSTTFATNVMEIAVPPANPGTVMQLSDLAKPGVKVAVCQDQVPCGAATGQVFANAQLAVRPVTLEPDVRSVLSKVTLGEVDAGVVYVTDVHSAGDKVTGVQIPADVNAATTYPITTLTDSGNATTAVAFANYVLSLQGQSLLSAAGFASP